MNQPKTDVDGGPGMGVGSATANAQARHASAAQRRKDLVRENALIAVTRELQESERRFGDLIKRVDEASASSDPAEAIMHVLAAVEAEERGRERR